MPAKMPGKFDEGDVLFANVVQNANRAGIFAGQPDDIAPRPAELAFQGLHLLDRGVEVLLEKCLRTSMNMVSSDPVFDGAVSPMLSVP